MGSIVSKKKDPSEPPQNFIGGEVGGGKKKNWLPIPMGKKGGDVGQSTGQLTTFLDTNGSILTKSNVADGGSSFFQYSDSVSGPAEQDKRATISLVNMT